MSMWSRIRAAFTSSAYDATTQGRGYRNFPQPGTGPTASILGAGDIVRRRSAHTTRNNAWGYAGLDSFACNAVGTGIVPRSGNKSAPLRRQIHDLWDDWTDDAVSEGIGDLYAAQLCAAWTVLETGDCFVRFRDRLVTDGLAVPLQINLYDAAMVPYWFTGVNPRTGNNIIAGIEFDPIGRKQTYWMYPSHPGERDFGMNGTQELVPVPATEILHMFRWRIAGQIRGEQALCRAMLRLYDLDEHARTEMLRQKAAASIAMVIVTPDPDNMHRALGEIDDGDPDETGRASVTIEPGAVPELLPGQQIQSHMPPDLASNLDTFIDTQLSAIAQSIGVTKVQLTGRLSDVNYSSARVGILEQRRRLEPWVWSVLVFQFCRPLWSRWFDTAVMVGLLRVADYNTPSVRRAAQRVSWHPQAHSWVDPLKEAQAQVLLMQNNLKSREQIITEQGYDPELVDAQIAADPLHAAGPGNTPQGPQDQPADGEPADTPADGEPADTPAESEQQTANA